MKELNGNIWKSVIIIVLTANLAFVTYLLKEVENLKTDLRIYKARSIINEQSIKTYQKFSENFINRELPNTYAEKEWVRNNFQEERK